MTWKKYKISVKRHWEFFKGENNFAINQINIEYDLLFRKFIIREWIDQLVNQVKYNKYNKIIVKMCVN